MHCASTRDREGTAAEGCYGWCLLHLSSGSVRHPPPFQGDSPRKCPGTGTALRSRWGQAALTPPLRGAGPGRRPGSLSPAAEQEAGRAVPPAVPPALSWEGPQEGSPCAPIQAVELCDSRGREDGGREEGGSASPASPLRAGWRG